MSYGNLPAQSSLAEMPFPFPELKFKSLSSFQIQHFPITRFLCVIKEFKAADIWRCTEDVPGPIKSAVR